MKRMIAGHIAVDLVVLPFLVSCAGDRRTADMNHPGKVYFVCRSEYEVPLGHRVVTFDAPDVLSWFRLHWTSRDLVSTAGPGEDWTDNEYEWNEVHLHTEKVFGGRVYGFERIWAQMARRPGGAPTNVGELREFLCGLDYPEGKVSFDPHAVQVKTDDDEIGIAWYLFDDEFARANPERVAYLLRTDPRLPVTYADRGASPAVDPAVDLGIGAGSAGVGNGSATYCLFLSTAHQWFGDEPRCFKFPGVRLPDLGAHLAGRVVPFKEMASGERWPTWPDELVLARAYSMRWNGDLEQVLRAIDAAGTRPSSFIDAMNLTDSRRKLNAPEFLCGDRNACLRDLERLHAIVPDYRKTVYERIVLPTDFQFSEHVIRLGFHDRLVEPGHPDAGTDSMTAWLFFDDLWIAANPDLAQSILHYASRWDCLFDGRVRKDR